MYGRVVTLIRCQLSKYIRVRRLSGRRTSGVVRAVLADLKICRELVLAAGAPA